MSEPYFICAHNWQTTLSLHTHTNSAINVAGCGENHSYYILTLKDSQAVRPKLVLATAKHQRASWEKKSQRSTLTIYTNLALRHSCFQCYVALFSEYFFDVFSLHFFFFFCHECVLSQWYTHKSLRAI